MTDQRIPPEKNKTAESHSIPGLIREMTRDMTAIVTKEVALAKAEIAQSAQAAKKGATSMISGGAVLYAGFLFLLLAAVAGLSNVMEVWLASLIVGGAVAIIGMIMVSSGKKKLEPAAFKPEHTVDSLKKDKRAVRGATS